MKVRRMLKNESGSVFVTAMLALVVLLILGVAFTSRSVNALYRADRDRQDTVALSLAECGIERATAELYEERIDAPYTNTFSVDSGSVTYTVTAPYQGLANTLEIVATGTTTRNVQARVRLVATRMDDEEVSMVFRGAIFSDNPLTLNGAGTVNPDENGEGGDIYSGGNITFHGTSFTMADTGHIYTAGETNWYPTNVPSSNVFEGIAPVPMPVIDMNWYRQHATRVINGNLNLTTGSISLSALSGGNPYAIVYVTGDVKIAGSYTGQGMIVAGGRISVTGNVTATNSEADALVLMSPSSVKLNGGPRVDGLIYAHNVTDDGSVTIGGNANIHGAVIADVVTTNGGITVTYDDVWEGLPLPGRNGTYQQLRQISWQRLK